MLKICRTTILFFDKKRLRPLLFLLAAHFFASISLSPSFGEELPIWTFDFRDVFYDIIFIDTQTAVIVGACGRVLVSHEPYKNLWSPRDSGTKELLTSLTFADEKKGWAAGHGGVIIHTSDGGDTWEVQRESSPHNQPLIDIQFVSNDVGYACGAYDTLLKTTDGGETWQSIPTGFDKIYNALHFFDEDTGYLVGESGTVLRTTNGGTSWEQLDLRGYRGAIFGITLVSRQEIIICGIAGKVMRSDDGGHTWHDIRTGIRESLFKGAVNGNEVVLVGKSGTILFSKDSGKSFIERKDNDLTSFSGVCSHPEGGFVCVGEMGKILRIESSRAP